MKKNFLKIGIFLISIFTCLLNAQAASFSVSTNTTNTVKGSTITLTIKGNDVTGRFNIATSNSNVISISEDRAWIENNSYSIKLSAINTGSATITVTPNGVSDSSGNPANLGAKSVKVTVTNPREKSSDNDLKSLSVEGFLLSPEFSKDIQVYHVTVPENTKEIEIKATPNSGYASVSGTGKKELMPGANSANIVVKSETGTEKIYTINIDVKDENPIIVSVDNKEYTVVKLAENLTAPETFTPSTITIENVSIPAFINTNANITLVGLKNEDGIINLFEYKNDTYTKYQEMKLDNLLLIPVPLNEELDFEKSKVNINGEEIECYKFNEEGTLVIINALNLKDGKTSLYLYDEENNNAINYNANLISNSKDTLKTYTYVIIAFAASSLLMLIIIICLLHSSSKKQKKINKFIERQEAKIEATRKLNDVVDEVKKITEKEENNSNYEKGDLTEVIKNLDLKEDKKSKKKKKNKDEEIAISKIEVNKKDDSEEVYDIFNDD